MKHEKLNDILDEAGVVIGIVDEYDDNNFFEVTRIVEIAHVKVEYGNYMINEVLVPLLEDIQNIDVSNTLKFVNDDSDEEKNKIILNKLDDLLEDSDHPELLKIAEELIERKIDLIKLIEALQSTNLN